MAISGITTSLVQSGLLAGTGTASASSGQPSPQSQSTSALDSSPAYQLSLGQQQTQTALLGYGRLGQLVDQADTQLAAMDSANPVVSQARLGDGTALTQSHVVDVTQLAQAQVLTSGSYSSASQTLGTGTLTIETGSVDAGGGFTPSGAPVSVPVTDGSLAGVAKAINAAGAGLAASVVQGSDGSYSLQVTGQTGAANAFSLSGVDALAYDPATASFTGLDATQAAQDAQYTVDGGATRTSPTNTGVTVAPGVTTTLAATGTTTLSVPFGFSQTAGAANALVDSVNTLLAGLSGLTGSGGELAGDGGPASTLTKTVTQALNQQFGQTSPSSLADIGIAVGGDGTLSIDSTKLQSAFAANASGTRSVLDQAAAAVHQALSGTGGESQQIKSQLHQFVTGLMAGMPTLAQILGETQNASSQAQSDSFGLGQANPLLGLLAGSGGQTQSDSLLAALGLGGQSATSTASTGVQAASASASVTA